MYRNIAAIKKAAANSDRSKEWFSPDAMQTWDSRILDTVLQLPEVGAVFLTSEKPSEIESRRYTLRFCDSTGEIRPASAFRAFRSVEQARQVAALLVADMAKNPQDYQGDGADIADSMRHFVAHLFPKKRTTEPK